MYRTIPEVFFELAGKYIKRTALLYKREGVFFPVSYKELSRKVNVFAAGLQKLNVLRGDRVAIFSENRPEWLISDLAIMSVGGVVVPLHTTFSPKAICTVLNHSEAKILIVSNSDLLHRVLLIKNELKFLQRIIFLDKLTAVEKENLNGKILTFEAIINRNKDEFFRRVFLDPDEICSIIYTSGTTGDPKGVPLTHRNFLSNVEAVNMAIPVKDNDIFLSFLPLSHVLERTAGQFIPLLHGATIAYAENMKTLPLNFKEIKPTVLISVPRVFEKFHDRIWDKINNGKKYKKELFTWALKQKRGTFLHKIANFLVFKKVRSQLGGKLRLAISGGASLNEDLAGFFLKIGVLVLEGYGLTETSPVITVNAEKDYKFGTVGKSLSCCKFKISQEKEILVKGINVFRGYYKDGEETAKSFDGGGWFHTGDLGFIDPEGFLTVTGRKKEMIVLSGGKNVWPEPIENLLDDDRFISQSVVIGNGQKFISALIVPDWREVQSYLREKNIPLIESSKLIKSEIIIRLFKERIDKKININLSEFEKIKKFRLLTQEFSQENDELTPTLKIRRQIIARHYEKEIESLYQEYPTVKKEPASAN